jgi:hypothetical protein
MKKNNYCMVKPLSGEEHVQVSGGYAPPTAEQMEQLREKYGLLADVVCWWILCKHNFNYSLEIAILLYFLYDIEFVKK